MKASDLERFMVEPWVMTGSDGSDGHPRKFGTFPRKLREYVFTSHLLTLPQAINKMTALPASRIHLSDRGRIAPNMAADVVVFDPATVQDTATYAEPFQYPVGIDAVIVNGVVALRDAQRGDRHTGRSLRAT